MIEIGEFLHHGDDIGSADLQNIGTLVTFSRTS